MLRHAIWILASVFILVVTAADRAPFGSGHAFAKGGDDGGGGNGGGVGAGSADANGGGGHTTNDRDSLSAFITSPVFGRVTSGVPSTIAAGPIFAPRAGLVCQRMTQTIDIDGQAVHASAMI